MGSMTVVDGVEVYRAEPSGAARGAVIVIEEIWGLVDHIKAVADRWAAEGYLALAPDLLSRGGISPEVGEELFRANSSPDEAVRTALQPTLRERLAPIREPAYGEWATAQLVKLVDALVAEPGIEGRIGVTGFCFGGTYAFALAAADDRVLATVPFYGTAPTPERIATISCPVLALYGEHDHALIEKLPAVRTAMREAGVDFADVVYEDAGHAFFNDTNSIAYRPEIAADAWARATAFIAEYLGR